MKRLWERLTHWIIPARLDVMPLEEYAGRGLVVVMLGSFGEDHNTWRFGVIDYDLHNVPDWP